MEQKLIEKIKIYQQKMIACEAQLDQVSQEMATLKKQKEARQINWFQFETKGNELKTIFEKAHAEYKQFQIEGNELINSCQVPQLTETEIEEILQLFAPLYLRELEDAIKTYYAPKIKACQACQRPAQLCSRSGGWSVDCSAANPLTAVMEQIPWCQESENRAENTPYLFATPAAAVQAWNARN